VYTYVAHWPWKSAASHNMHDYSYYHYIASLGKETILLKEAGVH
jgi:hypothetical protein